jgi:hypothetical protein
MEFVFEGHVDTKETAEEVLTRFELYAYTTPLLIYSAIHLINKCTTMCAVQLRL